MTESLNPPKNRTRRIAAVAALLVLVVALAWLRVGAVPQIEILPELPGIGARTPIKVVAGEPRRGLGEVRVELVQGERSTRVAERSFKPRPFWAFWGERKVLEEIELEVGRETLADLREGQATLRVTATRAPTWLRKPPPAVVERTLPVRFTPPRIEVTARQVYLAQGGSAVVTYRVGETSVRDGVRVADDWFPSYPLARAGGAERFVLFAARHDLEDASEVRLEAADELGNRTEVAFVDRYLPKPLRTDVINVSDRFMERVVPQILARTPELEDRGGLLANYLAINGQLRRVNTAELEELARRSQPQFLWHRAFLQQPNTRSMASFADRRTYLYDGREVDRQDHLGFDLASVRRAKVAAANDGVVLLARYFGIYGNTVVLDHGYGLLSLYAHLSSIGVEVGREVARGDTLGQSGETGLAGGDHLHFSMLVHGVQVNPLEWWDPAWIQSRIADKLGEAFGFEG